MMNSNSDSVRKIVQLSGGKIVGKTRLQKSMYLLEANGCGFGFDFSYHYYGPYSEDLAQIADESALNGSIHRTTGISQGGLSFFVFESEGGAAFQDSLDERRENILSVLGKYDAITLELAATADFLERNGYRADPWKEVKLRKSSKASDDRIEKAQRLLSEISNV